VDVAHAQRSLASLCWAAADGDQPWMAKSGKLKVSKTAMTRVKVLKHLFPYEVRQEEVHLECWEDPEMQRDALPLGRFADLTDARAAAE
jgi:hypothetical protein